MLPKKRNPASGASRHNRVTNIDVPGRKFDNDQYMVFDQSSKAASAAHRHVLASGSRSDGGLCLRHEYVDKRGLPLAPSYRIYKPESFSGFDFEISPSEDAVLFTTPGEHDPAAYNVARLKNALARTEWRRIIARSHKGLANEVGFGDQRALDLFWRYLMVIENDDHTVLIEFGFNPPFVVPSENYRDPMLGPADWRKWWRVPA